MNPPQILISAGEASSDMYGARLVAAIRARRNVQFFGMGGEKMRAAGAELIADASGIAVVGITEVFHKLPAVWRSWRRLEREAAQRKPVLAITIDSPGFNFGLARRLKKHGIRNVYFIAPQLWAWRPGRMRWIQRRFERVLVIFPFEEPLYRKAGVAANFVGHPLVNSVHADVTREEFTAKFALDASQPIVTILPGSRVSEIRRNLPIISEACAKLQSRRAIQFVVALAPGLDELKLRAAARPEFRFICVEGATYDALAAADCTIVSSGTATIEAALLNTPMVVVYRVSPLTAAIARPMIATPFFAMVNVIAGKRAVPELIQEKLTAESLISEIEKLLGCAQTRETQRYEFATLREKLGTGNAIENAAEIIARML